jgi:hypothetical protein
MPYEDWKEKYPPEESDVQKAAFEQNRPTE